MYVNCLYCNVITMNYNPLNSVLSKRFLSGEGALGNRLLGMFRKQDKLIPLYIFKVRGGSISIRVPEILRWCNVSRSTGAPCVKSSRECSKKTRSS